MVQVEEKRLAELLREEWKLNALKNGGVDNWEWYEESLYHPDVHIVMAMVRDQINEFAKAHNIDYQV